jgi:hypothetical protein
LQQVASASPADSAAIGMHDNPYTFHHHDSHLFAKHTYRLFRKYWGDQLFPQKG